MQAFWKIEPKNSLVGLASGVFLLITWCFGGYHLHILVEFHNLITKDEIFDNYFFELVKL